MRRKIVDQPLKLFAISKQQSPDVETDDSNLEELLINEVGTNAFEFIKQHYGNSDDRRLIISSSNVFNINRIRNQSFDVIVNASKVNSISRINKFFEAVNGKLEIGGIYIGKAQTISERKRRIYKKYWRPIADIRYFFDFLYTRVMPKVTGLKQIYFFITKGRRRVLSRAEVLGRLYSCGFTVIEETEVNNELYFAVKKTGEPAYDMNPSYGPIFKMKRVGKDGKDLYVYKLRTMHPFAEYLQEYIHQINQLQEGGKFHNDFRINTLGRFFRKFWIDELPMLINLVRGDMKIVGVRPLSSQYLSLYSIEMQEYRLKFKPGLVPPFYYDLPKTIEEIQESERRYLQSYEKNPLLTDLKYFMGAFWNILFKKARSS